MAQMTLSATQLQDVLTAYSTYQTEMAAAVALGMPRGTFQSRLYRARAWERAGKPGDAAAPPDPTRPRREREALDRGRTYEGAWLEWQRYIGQATAHYTKPK